MMTAGAQSSVRKKCFVPRLTSDKAPAALNTRRNGKRGTSCVTVVRFPRLKGG